MEVFMQNKSFFVIWGGQVVSILGSSLSWFAIGVWLYQKTGSASQFALVALCTALPQMLLSPFAGVLIDRYPRRLMMAVADTGAALCTLLLYVLFISGQIQVWHIYLTTALGAACSSLQIPAYKALVATLIEKVQLGRANGLLQFGQGLAEILAPALAGVLVLTLRVPGILLIDLVTFCVGILTLLLARIDEPQSHSQTTSPGSLEGWINDLRNGWQALRSDRGLVNFLRYEALFAFLWNLFAVLAVPMFLGLGDARSLGITLAIAGLGMLTGSLILSVWGGPKRRLTGLLFFEMFSALGFCLMGSRPLLWLVALAAFLAHFTLAFVSGLSESIWQGQVEKTLQGRVFSIKQAVVKAATMISYLAAGILADHVMEPLLRTGGPFVKSLGPWFGVGPGRGIALLFFLIGLVKAASVIWVYRSPGTRKMDAVISE
jgi:MFS transporter, DHA3 family, macrolide efflux protein